MNASSYLKVFDSIEIRGHKITHKSGIGLGFKTHPVVDYFLENIFNLFQRYGNHSYQSYVHIPYHKYFFIPSEFNNRSETHEKILKSKSL